MTREEFAAAFRCYIKYRGYNGIWPSAFENILFPAADEAGEPGEKIAEAARQAADSLKETAEQAKDLVAAEGIAAGPEELQYGFDELTKYEWIQNYRPKDIRV